MSLESVIAAVVFYGHDEDEELWAVDDSYLGIESFDNDSHKWEIISAIHYLWLGSPSARAILENWVENGEKFRFGEFEGYGKVNPYANDGYIALNIENIGKLNSINKQGETNEEFLPLVIIHEIIHLVNLPDNPDFFDPESQYGRDVNPGTVGKEGAGFDFSGATVALTNQIAVELGLEDLQRSSYQASSLETVLPDGFSYTGGDTIDVTIVGNDTGQNLDTSDQNGTRDLLLAKGGNDQMRSGLGNDYLWAGTGDDHLHGGAGADELIGEEGFDTVYFEESDEGVTVNLADGVGMHGDAEGDVYYGIEAVVGSGRQDHLIGNDQDNRLEGKGGDDLFQGGLGNDTLYGGAGKDIAYYDYVAGGAQYELVFQQTSENGVGLIREGETDTDFLFDVEEVYLSRASDRVALTEAPIELGGRTIIDGESGFEARDTLDLTILGQGVNFELGLVKGTDLEFRNFEVLNFGGGEDRVRHNVINSTIYLGGGADTLLGAAGGTEVYGGAGADRFYVSDVVRIMDASAEDRIYDAGGGIFTGALRWAGSALSWALNTSATVGYGINVEGDLVIRDFVRGTQMFVANYQSVLSGGQNTAGIHLAQFEVGAYRLLEEKPSHMTHMGFWELMLGHYLKANLGVSMWKGVDPLVLDLDGDGLELSGLSTYSPMFDYDGDGYGERGGWISGGDGFLVLDANADGRVTDVGELFGGPGLSGFAELALHDLNFDGVIDASDAVYSLLSVWRDLNQNRVVDDGEMASLASHGIASISVAGGASTATVNGNDVIATGGFTRLDGTTGVVADVGFRVDQQNSQWLGDRAISPAAAALPELRGYGTLVDLRVAMTRDPTLQTVAASVLPALDSLDLEAMRDAALPLFTAWADASPISGTAPLGGHEDVPVLTRIVDGQRVVADYAYEAVNAETGVSEWRLASTHAVIPDLQTLLGSSSGDPEADAWEVLEGGWIDFFERYLGEPLPIGDAPVNGSGAAAGLQGVIAGMWQQADLMTVRLAMQGPLSEFFGGLEYDVASDAFLPTTTRQLIPVFEAVFAEVAPMGPDGVGRLEAWSEILDVIIGDYRQPDGILNTNGFLFSNIVAAYESIGLALNIVDVSVALGLPGDLIRTGAGTLTGGGDADIFYLSAGDQILEGGLGPDTYVVGRGSGHDVIDDYEGQLQTHSEDVIRFADIRSDEVTATREGTDLIIRVNGTDDEVRVVEHFDGRTPAIGGGGDLSPSTGVDAILFSDGVYWTPFDVARAVSRFTAGDDVLAGTRTVDWLDGGAGNDFLSGLDDADVYVYGLGYDDDVISDLNDHIYLTGPDHVSFLDGITFEDLRFSRDGASDDLLITIDGQEGSLTIVKQFAATYTGVFGTVWMDQIEGFLFEDGSSAGWMDVIEALMDQASTDGNDVIHGFSLEDRLDGGAGDDFLSGGNENDTYVFGAGYGHDVIHERLDNILSGATDVVEFAEGLTPGDVAFSREGQDLVATLTATGETLRVRDQYVVTETGPFGARAFDLIEEFRFSDGSVLHWRDIQIAIIEASQTPGDDLIIGTHFDDEFEGGAGNDRIEGGNGGDTYRFNAGDGHDVIRDYCANLFTDRPDTVVFGDGISSEDVQITRYGADNNSVRLTLGGGESVSIEQQFNYTTIAFKEYEVEQFAFADGTVWTAHDLRLQYLQDAQTAGDDDVLGFWTNDVLEGGAGNDVLNGWDGSDTYVFELGFGIDEIREWVENVSYDDEDAIVFGAGLLSTDVVLTRDGDDLTIGFAGLTDQVTIFGHFEALAYFDGWRDIETISFGDGVTFDEAQIRTLLLSQARTAGDDVITGFITGDLMDGGAGNDVLRGLGGGDRYLFGNGSGQDTVHESIGTVYDDLPDTIEVAAGIAFDDVVMTREGDDLVLSQSGSTDTLRVVGHFGSTGYQAIERIAFADGRIVGQAEIELIVLANQSTPGDDVIVGTSGADVISGGAGNDLLQGDDGADTYYFGAGFGNDVIDENVSNVSISDFDIIVFGEGLQPSDAQLTREGEDLIISFPSGDSVRIVREFDHMAWFSGWEDIEEVRFQDGTVWTQANLREMLLDQASTPGNDVVRGYYGADVIDGGAGDDELHGDGGNDTYVFGFGSGHDRVHETYAVYEGEFDTIQLAEGVAPSDVAFGRSGSDLVLTLTGGADSLTVVGFFTAQNREVDLVTFADGTSLSLEAIVAQVTASQTTAGDDIVLGSRLADTLAGGAGNDEVSGGAGSDTYLFGPGDGLDAIEDNGSGADRIELGAGISPAEVALYRSGAHLVIELGDGVLDALVVRNQFGTSADQIESLVFADGTIWGAAEIQAALTPIPAGHIVGTFLGETLTGTSAADTLNGRRGADTLSGGAGDDTYLYAAGDGDDVLADTSTTTTSVDVLRFTDITAEDVRLERVGADLKVILPAATLTVTGHFNQSGAGRGIERIELADGVAWDRAAIDAAAWVYGTSGDDIITVGAGDTTIVGGLGADVLTGGAGADTYVHSSGDGADRIVETSSIGADVLHLTDLAPDDVMLTRSGTHLLVTDRLTGQVIRIDNQHYTATTASSYGVEQIRFADGTLWSRAEMQAHTWIVGTEAADTLSGSDLGDQFDGGLGDDTINSAKGSDTFIYRSGDGSDRIDEEDRSTTSVDVLRLLDIASGNITLSRVGTDLMIRDELTGHVIEIDEQFYSADHYGLEELRTADGVVWTRGDLQALAWYRGTAGTDSMSGSALNDTFIGDLGDDNIHSTTGSDTFIYRSGDGSDRIDEENNTATAVDVLRLLDVASTQVTLSRVGTDLMIRDDLTGHVIEIDEQFYTATSYYGIEQLSFSDGVIWSRTDLQSLAWYRGTDAADSLAGSFGADTLVGGLGDDYLAGGAGGDVYIYRSGDGADRIYDTSATGADSLALADLNLADVSITRVVNDLFITDISTGQAVRVESHFSSGATGNGYGVEDIHFANGVHWNRQQILDHVTPLAAARLMSDDALTSPMHTKPWLAKKSFTSAHEADFLISEHDDAFVLYTTSWTEEIVKIGEMDRSAMWDEPSSEMASIPYWKVLPEVSGADVPMSFESGLFQDRIENDWFWQA